MSDIFEKAFQELRNEAQADLKPEAELEFAFQVKEYLQVIAKMEGEETAIAVMRKLVDTMKEMRSADEK